MAITDYKVSETYAGRDISSLSDRPNQDGMTAAQLKARFDQLGKEVIPNYNDLIDFINLNLFSGGTQIGHTHNVDILEDGTTNRLYTDVEKTKLAGIAEGAEVNQNAFSNVKVGSTTIASSVKTDTFELVAGLNITMAVDSLTKKITFSATGDLATEAVQSLILDIGNYYDSLNVEDALQEIGYALANLSGNAEDIAITDVGEYFTSENVEGALQEVGFNLGGKSPTSHTHTIANVTGLQTALDGKVDDSQVLTNVPAGAVFTDTVYVHPATHAISEVSGLQTALDAKAPLASPALVTPTVSGSGRIISNDTATGTAVFEIWSGTQAQYDAIGTKDANTLYFIV